MDYLTMKRTELPPPTCYMKTLLNLKIEEIFRKICEVLTNSIAILEKQDALSMESYVIYKMLYKLNSQWRREKSLQGLKRVRCCLNRYSELKVLEYMKELKEHFDECNLFMGEIYLPTRQMMVYLLKQIMCIAYLMSQLCSYCQHSYIYISQHLAIGNFVPQNMIFLSLVSRIWTLGKSLGLHSVKWYNDIIGLVDIFPNTQSSADNDTKLPNDLNAVFYEELCEVKSPDEISVDATGLHELDDSFSEERMEMDERSDNNNDQSVENDKEISDGKINTFTLSDDELRCTESREDTKSSKTGNVKKEITPVTLSGVDDFDEGCVVDRDTITPLSSESREFNIIEFKHKVDSCKSFKKLQERLKDLELHYGKTDRLQECSRHMKTLKKEYMQLKRSGKKDNKFIEDAKNILKKVAKLENNSKPKENGRLKDRNNDCLKLKNVTSVINDFDIEDIFKKPLKNLKNLVSRHYGTNKCKEKSCKKKIKACALMLKTLKKSFIEENKKKYIKKGRREVNNLLAMIG